MSTWTIDINAKSAKNIFDIEQLILQSFDLDFYNCCNGNSNCFLDHMRDIYIGPDIDKVIINIKEPNKKNNKKKKNDISKEVLSFKEFLTNDVIPEIRKNKRINMEINWI